MGGGGVGGGAGGRGRGEGGRGGGRGCLHGISLHSAETTMMDIPLESERQVHGALLSWGCGRRLAGRNFMLF